MHETHPNVDDFLYAHIARGHRHMQDATSGAESDHWALEADRFEELASLARTNPGEARNRYRPTRAHQPDEA